MRLSHLLIFTATLIASTCTSTHATDDGRPRGVKKVDIPLYTGSTFTCRSDPSIVIPASHINDDYCDCTDGSDEPGTSACDRGNFWCRNVGWRGEMIKASRVNDGICDCCDGSDEWQGRITCPNTCVELGKSAGEDQLAKIQKMEAGAAKRSELVTEAERVLAERKAKLAKYEARIAEKAAILEELRQKKEAAEVIEAEEKRIADEIQAAKDAEAARLAEEKQAEEAANAAVNPPAEGEAAQSSDGTPATLPVDNKPVEVEIPATPDAGATPSGIAGIGMAGVGIPKIPEPAVESFPYPAEYAYNPTAEKDKVQESATQPAEDPVLKDAQDDEYNDEEDEPAPPSESTRTEAQQEEPEQPRLGVASIRGVAPPRKREESAAEKPKKKKKKKGKKGTKGKKKKTSEEEYPIYGPRTLAQHEQWKLDEKKRESDEAAEKAKEDALAAEKKLIKEERAKKREQRKRRQELGIEDDTKEDAKEQARWQEKWNQIMNATYDTPADAARAQYNEMESSHRKTQDKLDKLKKLLDNDYGDHGEFTMLEGQCYQIVIRQYTYEVCPYDESRQIEGHSRTSLGKYSGWRSRVIDPLAPADKGHVYGRIMEFTGGVTCWNGPQRSAAIEFECGEQTSILTVDEPSRCVYAMRMSTPAVCKPEEIQAMREKLEHEMKLTAESEEQ